MELDLETLVSLSTGLLFELMVLTASRVFSHTTLEHRLREQERRERQRQVDVLDQGNSEIYGGMQEVREEIRSLRAQVSENSEELKRLRWHALQSPLQDPPPPAGVAGAEGGPSPGMPPAPSGWRDLSSMVSSSGESSPHGAVGARGSSGPGAGGVGGAGVAGGGAMRRTLENFLRASGGAAGSAADGAAVPAGAPGGGQHAELLEAVDAVLGPPVTEADAQLGAEEAAAAAMHPVFALRRRGNSARGPGL